MKRLWTAFDSNRLRWWNRTDLAEAMGYRIGCFEPELVEMSMLKMLDSKTDGRTSYRLNAYGCQIIQTSQPPACHWYIPHRFNRAQR